MRRLPGWISRADRDAVALRVSARLGNGREVEVQVTDLSTEGCRVESDLTLLIGDVITLNAAPLRDVSAIIRWELLRPGRLDLNAPAVQPRPRAPQPVEHGKRRVVSLRGHAVLPDLSIVEVMVEVLCYDGCKIQTPRALTAGAKIRLGVLERGMIEAQVRWYARGKAGLAFGPQANDAAADPQLERQGQRVPLFAEVTMRRLGRLSYRVRVFDASTHGCKVEFIERPAIGEQVLVRLDGLQPLDARICWIEGNHAGVELERPIHPAVFGLLVARMQSERDGA